MKLSMSMKHPFWLVNSILLLFLFFALLFMLVSQQKKPRRVSFEPEDVKPLKKDISKVDPSKIYTNDLFNTYQEPKPPAMAINGLKPMPQPPLPAALKPPAATPPRFLDPLTITLKGIILTGEENDNRAILENNKTKVAKNYKIGDKIEDAQLTRILKNKVMLVRSNGQQETLYVNQFDAKAEQLHKQANDWSTVTKKINNENYIVDPYEFTTRIRSLAQFIDVLNITTVYKQGKSIGIRIGKLQAESLGTSLGLQQGDIITAINGTPATDTKNRFEIYKKIINMATGSIIKVSVLRQLRTFQLTYTLKPVDIQAEESPVSDSMQRAVKIIDPEQEKQNIIQDKIAYATPDGHMRKLEKHAMLEKGKKGTSARKKVLTDSFAPKESVS